jgi:hypothetical protein
MGFEIKFMGKESVMVSVLTGLGAQSMLVILKQTVQQSASPRKSRGFSFLFPYGHTSFFRAWPS